MRDIKTATCRRCGSVSVAWAKSARTGRWYLALAVQATTREDGVIYPQTPHRCEDPNRGGFKQCTLCGEHHISPFGLPDPAACETHQDRKNQK